MIAYAPLNATVKPRDDVFDGQSIVAILRKFEAILGAGVRITFALNPDTQSLGFRIQSDLWEWERFISLRELDRAKLNFVALELEHAQYEMKMKVERAKAEKGST